MQTLALDFRPDLQIRFYGSLSGEMANKPEFTANLFSMAAAYCTDTSRSLEASMELVIVP